jgi:hypothetical protein
MVVLLEVEHEEWYRPETLKENLPDWLIDQLTRDDQLEEPYRVVDLIVFGPEDEDLSLRDMREEFYFSKGEQ